MSRGRGGPSKEPYHRYPQPNIQAKETYRPAPTSHFARGGLQQFPYLSCYNSLVPPVGYSSHPASPGVPVAPPVLNHNRPDSKSVGFNNSDQSPRPSPVSNSFQVQQAEFLRGHLSDAPNFRTGLRGGRGASVPSRSPSSSYQSQSRYTRYPNSNTGSRNRCGFSQDQRTAFSPSGEPPRGTQVHGHRDVNHLHGQSNRQYSKRPRLTQGNSLCDSFHSLTLSQNRLNKEETRAGRQSSRSSFSGAKKVTIILTPAHQEEVHRALVALEPGESISAKALAKKLRLPKKIVNKALYALERSAKASKQGILPPEWTVYREPVGCPANSEVRSPESHQEVAGNSKAEVKVTTEENNGTEQVKDEDSDTDSTSSYCSSSSVEFKVFQSLAQGHGQERKPPCTAVFTRQTPQPSTMSDQKEQILHFLCGSGEATALVIAKNLGLKNAKHVNPTLYALEKQGQVSKNHDVTPHTWELSTHCRERMERSLKAAQANQADMCRMDVAVSRETPQSSPLTLMTDSELNTFPLNWKPKPSHSKAAGEVSRVNVASRPVNLMTHHQYDNVVTFL